MRRPRITFSWNFHSEIPMQSHTDASAFANERDSLFLAQGPFARRFFQQTAATNAVATIVHGFDSGQPLTAFVLAKDAVHLEVEVTAVRRPSNFSTYSARTGDEEPGVGPQRRRLPTRRAAQRLRRAIPFVAHGRKSMTHGGAEHVLPANIPVEMLIPNNGIDALVASLIGKARSEKRVLLARNGRAMSSLVF